MTIEKNHEDEPGQQAAADKALPADAPESAPATPRVPEYTEIETAELDRVDETEGEDEEEESPGDETSAGLTPEAQLQALLDAAKGGRPSPADEERAVQLLKQTIPRGPKALPAALDALLTLQWSASVKAVTEAWPETKPAGRARLLTGLARQDGDISRRIRLSLARGLHAQDPASALKLIQGVCDAMGGAAGGSTNKDRQVFANVMLGKARPWLVNIAMAEMKPADALKLIIPALESCHQAPIFTQIWVLRWIIDAGKFDSLSPEHIASIGKSINRWQPRWRKELRKIIPKLPESLESALGDDRPPARPAAIASTEAEREGAQSASAAPAPEDEDAGDEEEEDDEDDEEEDEDQEDEEEVDEDDPAATLAAIAAQPPRQRPQSPQQQRGGGRDRGDRGGQPFDLIRSLREIESYVNRLRSELQQAQVAARKREQPPRRGQQQPALSGEETEELRRHNAQLEEQNQEMRQRIEDLLSDHEDRAATLGVNDSLEQFKIFLGLKLKEDFADYAAISRESLNEVVRRHAHEILGHLFAVLQSEGVRFDRES